MALVPLSEIAHRLQRLRAAMRRDRMSAAYLSSPPSVHYYSGFTGSDTVLLVTQRRSILITDFRFQEEAESSATLARPLLWKKDPAQHAGLFVRKLGLNRLGFEEGALPVGQMTAMRKAARGVRFIPWGKEILKPRLVKSAWEIRSIQKALRVAEASFMTARKRLKAGVTELEIANDLEFEMRRRGAVGAAFPSIVAMGPNTSRPHAHPGRRRLANDSLILIDWGARVGFYNSDLTRTLFFGTIPAVWRDRYARVWEAQHIAIQSLAAGTSGAEVDEAARSHLRLHALDRRFGHSLGHGVGLEVHEGPRLSRLMKAELPTGAVVTVEPGVYFPGQGGIRIEDMILIRGKRSRVLSRLPRDWDSAQL
ncbi:MAG: Xaa-Pro peptidase family protein [Planctomycetota bacterium]